MRFFVDRSISTFFYLIGCKCRGIAVLFIDIINRFTEGTKGSERSEGTEGTEGTEGSEGSEGTERTEGTERIEGTEGIEGSETCIKEISRSDVSYIWEK